MEIIKPALGTVIWMTIAFSIVFFILAKYAWRPIMSYLKERENSIADALQAAKLAKEEISKLKADNEKIIAEARRERDRIIAETKELKDSILSTAKEQAGEETKKMIDLARQAIKSEKESAISEMKEQIIVLSVDIAGKILNQKLSDDEKQREFIEKSLRDVKLN